MRSTSVAEDRNRQLAAAAWILGWIGGPLPAILILLVARVPDRTRRLVRAAAVFWALVWGVFLTLISLGATRDVPLFGLWWLLAALVALAGTLVGPWIAVRQSRESNHRETW